jgi:hypothetical protein
MLVVGGECERLSERDSSLVIYNSASRPLVLRGTATPIWRGHRRSEQLVVGLGNFEELIQEIGIRTVLPTGGSRKSEATARHRWRSRNLESFNVSARRRKPGAGFHGVALTIPEHAPDGGETERGLSSFSLAHVFAALRACVNASGNFPICCQQLCIEPRPHGTGMGIFPAHRRRPCLPFFQLGMVGERCDTVLLRRIRGKKPELGDIDTPSFLGSTASSP